MAEGEEVSLEFESFLHNNGTLYSCFSHHGNRVYVDESQVGTKHLLEEGGGVAVELFLLHIILERRMFETEKKI